VVVISMTLYLCIHALKGKMLKLLTTPNSTDIRFTALAWHALTQGQRSRSQLPCYLYCLTASIRMQCYFFCYLA